MRQDEWSRSVVGVIAKAVRWHREQRGMSAQRLADECERLGYSVPRSVITNLENGRRDMVTVPEWLVLAAAIGVPPLLLAFPVGRDGMVEVLPEQEVPTWEAAKWFTGEGPLPHATLDDFKFKEWREGVAAVDLARDHDRVCDRWRSLATILRDSTEASAEYRRSVEAELRRVEAQLALTRDSMRRGGLTPPELTVNLRHVDEIDPAKAADRILEGA